MKSGRSDQDYFPTLPQLTRLPGSICPLWSGACWSPSPTTYLELTELRRPTGEKSTGELTADPRDRPLLLARGVDAGPIPTSGPLRVPGPGVRGEETPGNMSAGSWRELHPQAKNVNLPR